MTEIELLSKTETEPGGTNPYKMMLLYSIFMAICAVTVFSLMTVWDMFGNILVPIVGSLSAVCGVGYSYYLLKHRQPPRVPVSEGAVEVSESGLLFKTAGTSAMVKPDEIESMRIVFNGVYGKTPVELQDKDGESMIKNMISVNLKSGREMDFPYMIKDAAQRKQFRNELRLLGKAGVKYTVRNTGDKEAHYL